MGSTARPVVQQTLIALAGATRFMSGIMMGTAMAIYVGPPEGSKFAASMVLAAYFLGMTVFAPVWGAVADVTGRRREVMILTGGLATLAVVPLVVLGRAGPTLVLGSVTVDGVWLPIGIRSVYAIFATGFVPVMLTVVSTQGGDEARGRSLGFFNSARGVGFTSGQLLVGLLLGLLAPEGLYLVVAAVSFVSVLAAALVADPTPSPDTDPSIGEILAEVRRRLLPAVGDRTHLRTNGLRWLYVALALRNMTVLGVMSLMPIYLTGADAVALSTVMMGAILAINPGGQVVFMYVFGRLADSVGRKPLIVAGMGGSGLFALISAAALVPTGTAGRVAVAALAFVVIAAAFSAMTTGALAFIGDVAPPNRESELMGLRSTAKGVGGVLGPPILGVIGTVISYQVAFAVGSTLAIAAAVLASLALTESRGPGGSVRGGVEIADD